MKSLADQYDDQAVEIAHLRVRVAELEKQRDELQAANTREVCGRRVAEEVVAHYEATLLKVAGMAPCRCGPERGCCAGTVALLAVSDVQRATRKP